MLLPQTTSAQTPFLSPNTANRRATRSGARWAATSIAGLAALAMLPPHTVQADRLIDTDVQQAGGTFEVDPAGTLTISGANSPQLALIQGATTAGIGQLVLGAADGESGQLLLASGSTLLNTGNAELGGLEGTLGSATVSGPGSRWENAGRLILGTWGQGMLTLQEGGRMDSTTVQIGTHSYSSGQVHVMGTGTLLNAGTVFFGESVNDQHGSQGVLRITDGGTVKADYFYQGANISLSPSLATTEIRGIDSLLEVHHHLAISYSSEAHLLLADGARIQAARSTIGLGDYYGINRGSALITDNGSLFETLGTLSVGHEVRGDLSIEAGAVVTSQNTLVGYGRGDAGHGTVTVSGSDTLWETQQRLIIGGSTDSTTLQGTGEVQVVDGGQVRSHTALLGAGPYDSVSTHGEVTLSGTDSRWDNTGALFIGGTEIGRAGTGHLAIHDGAVVAVGGGVTIWESGQLSGHGGTLLGDVVNHGLIGPGQSPGILTIDGDLTLAATSLLSLEIGGATTPGIDHDQLVITGDLWLDGTIALTFLDAYEPLVGESFDLLQIAGQVHGVWDPLAWQTSLEMTFDLAMVDSFLRLTVLSVVPGGPTVVPTPSALALAALGGLLLLRRRGSVV